MLSFCDFLSLRGFLSSPNSSTFSLLDFLSSPISDSSSFLDFLSSRVFDVSSFPSLPSLFPLPPLFPLHPVIHQRRSEGARLSPRRSLNRGRSLRPNSVRTSRGPTKERKSPPPGPRHFSISSTSSTSSTSCTSSTPCLALVALRPLFPALLWFL